MILTLLIFDNFTQQTYFQTSIPLLVLLLDAGCDHNKIKNLSLLLLRPIW